MYNTLGIEIIHPFKEKFAIRIPRIPRETTETTFIKERNKMVRKIVCKKVHEHGVLICCSFAGTTEGYANVSE